MISDRNFSQARSIDVNQFIQNLPQTQSQVVDYTKFQYPQQRNQPNIQQFTQQFPPQIQQQVLQQNPYQTNQSQPIARYVQQIPVPVMQPAPVKLQPPPQPTEEPFVHEVYHVERGLQVISVENVEEPWKKKVIELEVLIYDLQTELARYKKQGNSGQGSDSNKAQELENKIRNMTQNEQQYLREIEQLQQDNEELHRRYYDIQKQLQDQHSRNDEQRDLRAEINDRQATIRQMDDRIQKLTRELHDQKYQLTARDNENSQLQRQINELNQYIDQISSNDTLIQSLTNDVELWKKKFRDLNQQFYQCQEDLMVTQAELDALKNKKIQVTSQISQPLNITNVSRPQQRPSVNLRVSGVNN